MTCFAIMPFGAGFAKVGRIVQEAAVECGLAYVRGDQINEPGSVVSQIVEHLRHATIVVADISNGNPNVFYELGIAHQLLGRNRVVIITSSPEEVPYDVRELRHLIYAGDPNGLKKLRKELPAFLTEAIKMCNDNELWSVIRGPLPRTLLLVQDLQRFVQHILVRKIKKPTIRIVAGLSSLAISDNEPDHSPLSGEYRTALLAERDMVRKALVVGANAKMVLNPPHRLTAGKLPERILVRYKRLIGLLNDISDTKGGNQAKADDLKAIKKCKIALSSTPMPNLIILGDVVAYEGIKRGGTPGFEITHRETNSNRLAEMIEQFDGLFKESSEHMAARYPPDGRVVEQLENFLKEATGHV